MEHSDIAEPTQQKAAKGRFTFRFTAACFGLSAIGELFGLHDSTVLFGSVVAGNGALIYHLIYVLMFTWLTFGLWNGSRSGYYVLIGSTIFYTVDRLQLLFVGNALKITIRAQLAGSAGLLSAADMSYVAQVITIAIIVLILCWWAFVAYAYARRGYFGIR